MRFALLTTVVLYTVNSWAAVELDISITQRLQTRIDKNHPLSQIFLEYKVIFNKSYSSIVEERRRQTIFEDNVDYIRHHNIRYAKGHNSYTLSVNEFSDLSHKEFLSLYTSRIKIGAAATNISSYRQPEYRRTLPTTVDWRNQGYVTGVKSQGICGACWAFTTTGTLEGQLFARTGRLVSLSEQQLVDCNKMNGGCQHGFVELAMTYISQTGGLVSEKAYPYTAETECRYDRRDIVPGSHVIGYWTVYPGDEQDLQKSVADVGPFAAAIDASHKAFQHYSTGVYDEPNCSQYDLDHGVLVVGYGSNPKDYWLVKNSWGLTWGEAGYARMARNKKNQCGIATQAIYPVL